MLKFFGFYEKNKNKAGNQIHILSKENLDLFQLLLFLVEAPHAFE